MAERPRVTIPLGAGLSRNVGAYVAEANSFRDVRNVELAQGKMSGRRGLLRTGLIVPADLDETATVIGVYPVRSAGIGVILAYVSAGALDPDARVDAWKVDGTGASPVLIGTVWTLGSGVLRLPRVSAADSYGKLLIAHDKEGSGARSRVYDVGTNLITDLDLGDGMHTPKFRGFVRHLAYIFGWGWGTDADPFRSEIVRVCVPADPLTWDINHYFVAGQRDDPVLQCKPAGRGLLVMKPSESYDIHGYDRASFGIDPADDKYGVISSRASETVGGVNYRWSHMGPRRSTGGPSVDLALPLDIQGPLADPRAVASVSGRNYVFTAYDPNTQELAFVFESQWGYVLHLADAQNPVWSYRVFDPILRSAGILYDTSV